MSIYQNDWNDVPAGYYADPEIKAHHDRKMSELQPRDDDQLDCWFCTATVHEDTCYWVEGLEDWPEPVCHDCKIENDADAE